MSSDELKPRGEFDRVLDYIRLQDWKGNVHDILTQMVEFSFEEEIFFQCIHGSVRMFDSVDFPTLLPLIGEERISASFTRQIVPDQSNAWLGGKYPPIKFDLQVYAMENKSQGAESRKAQSYTLKYTSNLPFLNVNKRVFTSYKDMKYSDMVKKIYEDYLKEDEPFTKPLNVEETKYTKDFCVQNLSPLNAIRKICQRSTSAEDNGNFYVFYEDRDSYNFVTLGKLLQQDPVITLTCELKNVSKPDENPGPKTIDLAKQMYNVPNYVRNSSFDVLGSGISGEGASSMFSVDPISRKFYFNEFDLRGTDAKGANQWEKLPRLGDKKPWTKDNKMFVDPKANMALVITDINQDTHPYISEKETVRPTAPEEFLLERNSHKKQLFRNLLYTTVSGDPRIKVGSVIKFDIPEILGKTSEKDPERMDKWLQGNYLIIGILHQVTQSDYKMRLELMRDGFSTEIKDSTYRHPSVEYKDHYNS